MRERGNKANRQHPSKAITTERILYNPRTLHKLSIHTNLTINLTDPKLLPLIPPIKLLSFKVFPKHPAISIIKVKFEGNMTTISKAPA